MVPMAHNDGLNEGKLGFQCATYESSTKENHGSSEGEWGLDEREPWSKHWFSEGNSERERKIGLVMGLNEAELLNTFSKREMVAARVKKKELELATF